jgi:predicted ATPase
LITRIVLTGGPGFGKSSIVEELNKRGLNVFQEISREIIQEQMNAGGDLTPWQNVEGFSKRVYQGRINQYQTAQTGVNFYDRGIPDIAGFMRKDKLIFPDYLWNQCVNLSYHKQVFITPPWEAIFQGDSERKEDFATAIKVHKGLESVYLELGYTLIPVPMGSVISRATFILDQLGMH